MEEIVTVLKTVTKNLAKIRLYIFKSEYNCIECINKGDREISKIFLENINSISNVFGIEYKNLKDLYERKTKVFPYVENNNKLILKKEIVSLMIDYAKSKYNVPSELLIHKCHSYFNALSLNAEERRKAINGLIVLCMDSCSNEQLKKLDNTVDVLCNI